jgi:hypothetical protein
VVPTRYVASRLVPAVVVADDPGVFFDAALRWLRARLGRRSSGPAHATRVETGTAPRPWYLERQFKSTRDFIRVFREVSGYAMGDEMALSLGEGEPQDEASRRRLEHLTKNRRHRRILASRARKAGLIDADDEAALVGDDPEVATATMVRLYGGPEPNEPRPVDLAGPPISDARREGGATTVVFISWAGAIAITRERARDADWARALRAAGFAVIDHPAFAGYEWILADIARSDAMVAIVSPGAGTWAVTEWTSAAWGRDTKDGLCGSWKPAPVFAWFVEPAPRLTHLLERTECLPDDFDAAVAYVIRALRQPNEEPAP